MIQAISGLAIEGQVSDVETLASSYGSWSGIRTNHVISSTGSFLDDAGSSRGLSTTEDLQLLIALRREADLVIVDAATARNERYRKLSTAHLAIVSASGNFEAIPASEATTGVTLFTPNTSDSNNSPLEQVAIDPSDPFEKLLAWAREQELNSLLLEAGPTLTRLCFSTTKVSQSAITITPKLPLESLSQELNPFSRHSELISVAESIDATFTLWSY